MYDPMMSGTQEQLVARDVLRDVENISRAGSDELIVRAIAAAFARTPLASDELRDIKLITFLMDVDAGRLDPARIVERAPFPALARWVDELSVLGGISKVRVHSAVQRLFDAQVLIRLNDQGIERFDFADSVLEPVTRAHHIAWQAVVRTLTGRTAALLVLRAAIDLIPTPWQWSRLTHDRLAEHACYSIGMVQKALDVLLETGVLERSVRVGRGHDYRFSAWALGRARSPQTHSTDHGNQQPDSLALPETTPRSVFAPILEKSG